MNIQTSAPQATPASLTAEEAGRAPLAPARQGGLEERVRPERLGEAVRQCQAWIMPAGSGWWANDGLEFHGRAGARMTVKTSPDGTIEVVSDYPHRHCRSTLIPAGHGRWVESTLKILYAVERTPAGPARGKEFQRTESRFNETGMAIFTRTEKPRANGKSVTFALGQHTRRSWTHCDQAAL